MKKENGKWKMIAAFFLSGLLLSAGAWAAPPADKGGGPPDGKGRKPKDPGGSIKGDLMGDLWVVVRDVGSGDGAPVHFAWEWDAACYDAAGDFDATFPDCVPLDFTAGVEEGCVQPVTYENVIGIDPQFIYDPDDTEVVFPFVDSYGEAQLVNLIPLDPECKIPAGKEDTWGTQTIEVESGRLNLARTTDYVIEAAYGEAIAVINTASPDDMDGDGIDEPPVTLDAAGRLVLILHDADGLPYWKTVDSPRENLALMKAILIGIRDNGEGCLPGLELSLDDLGELAHLACGAPVDDPDRDLLRAASFLAGAADKFGAVSIDEVVYLNNVLWINTIEESSTGALFVTDYFDVKDDFTYVRLGEYGDATADLLQPPDGATEYPSSFDVVYGVRIYDKVFAADWDGNDYAFPLVNFVRAADDAVKVIFYIHNYELPEFLIPSPVPDDFLSERSPMLGPIELR